eukprot:1160144-Pelagomonas_calceolata.AAC.1
MEHRDFNRKRQIPILHSLQEGSILLEPTTCNGNPSGRLSPWLSQVWYLLGLGDMKPEDQSYCAEMGSSRTPKK